MPPINITSFPSDTVVFSAFGMTLFPHSLKESRLLRAEPLKSSLEVSTEIQFPQETDGDNYLHVCETDECTFLKVAPLLLVRQLCRGSNSMSQSRRDRGVRSAHAESSQQTIENGRDRWLHKNVFSANYNVSRKRFVCKGFFN